MARALQKSCKASRISESFSMFVMRNDIFRRLEDSNVENRWRKVHVFQPVSGIPLKKQASDGWRYNFYEYGYYLLY